MSDGSWDIKASAEGDIPEDGVPFSVFESEAARKERLECERARNFGTLMDFEMSDVVPWSGHARWYEGLSETSERPLIDLIEATGQTEPVVGRPMRDGSGKIEIVVGLRRLWAIAYLNLHSARRPITVFVRCLSDEEAFRLGDFENRVRKDLTILERARSYSHALKTYYGNSQTRMADALRISKSQVSRVVGIADLPDVVLQAFGTGAIPQKLGNELNAALKDEGRAPKLLKHAETLAEKQRSLGDASDCGMSARQIAHSILNCDRPRPVKTRGKTVLSKRGRPLMTIKPSSDEALNICIHAWSSATLDEIGRAVADAIRTSEHGRNFADDFDHVPVAPCNSGCTDDRGAA